MSMPGSRAVEPRTSVRWRRRSVRRSGSAPGPAGNQVVVEGVVRARLLGVRLLSIDLQLLIDPVEALEITDLLPTGPPRRPTIEGAATDSDALLPAVAPDGRRRSGEGLSRAAQLLREGEAAREEARRLR